MYNYWEPVHLLATRAAERTPVAAFETWEYAPQYAIRSWAYAALHAWVPAIVSLAARKDYAFYALRFALAVVSAAADACLYRAVAQAVNARVARYMLALLATSAGLVTASVALLPSSLVMYTTTLAMSAVMFRTQLAAPRRTYAATLAFALGALAGWPYALVAAVPFVLEELFLTAGDAVPAGGRLRWLWQRWSRGICAALLASLLAVPLLLLDSLAYGRVALVPLNTVLYNVLGRARGTGPELYGTEPPWYYVVNLVLNFGAAAPLALVALPAVYLTAFRDTARFTGVWDARRAGAPKAGARPPTASSATSPVLLLTMRLLPFYLWFSLLTAQAHKEERFLYPVYSLLCFNAAVTVFVLRGWLENAYIRVTRSPYKAAHTWALPACTLGMVLAAAVPGLLRAAALTEYYGVPMRVLAPLWHEAPQDRTLCYAKEWHRFPSHFHVPQHVQVQFVRSEFHGILPHHFERGSPAPAPPEQRALIRELDHALGWLWPWAPLTRTAPARVNEHNREEPDRFVDIAQCDYLVDMHVPVRAPAPAEPTYALQPEWDRVACDAFLDADASRAAASRLAGVDRLLASLARILWLPPAWVPQWHAPLQFGEYCLLRRAT